MKRIRTSESVGLLRLTLIVCALVATVGVGSGIADDKGAKATVVYDHVLPNVLGKSMKGILVEYGPGEGSPAHIHPKSAFTYATVLEGAVRTWSMMGRPWFIKPGRASLRCLVIDTVLMRMRARPNLPRCWP